MTVDIAKLRALLKSGTRLPWSVDYQHGASRGGRVMGIFGPPYAMDYGDIACETVRDRIVETDGGYYEPRSFDADLIVGAVNALPELLAIADAVEKLLSQWPAQYRGALRSEFREFMAAVDAARKP